MRQIIALLILSAMAAHADDGSQDDALPTRYVCVESKEMEGKGAPTTALQMLEYVNRQLDRARVLTFSGETADFGHSLPDEPAYTVVVRHNDISILARGFLLDGGEGCNALTSPPSGKCSWRVLDLKPEDQS